MSFFVGLHTERRSPSDSNPRIYALPTDAPADETLEAGTHVCVNTSPLPPFVSIDVDCPNEGTLEIDTDFDLMAATFSLGTAQTISDRAALTPTPDYVQIFLATSGATSYETTGGNNTCAPGDTGCADPVDGTLNLSVTTPVSELAYGVGGAPAASTPIPGGNDSFTLQGNMVRTAGAVYTGDPGNPDLDQLIPWSEFVADAALNVVAVAENVHSLRRRTVALGVFLWFVNPPASRRGQIIGHA